MCRIENNKKRIRIKNKKNDKHCFQEKYIILIELSKFYKEEPLICSDRLLNLSKGDKVEFVMSRHSFYFMFHTFDFIYEIKIDGKTLLNFDEGKEFLFEYFKSLNDSIKS